MKKMPIFFVVFVIAIPSSFKLISACFKFNLKLDTEVDLVTTQLKESSNTESTIEQHPTQNRPFKILKLGQMESGITQVKQFESVEGETPFSSSEWKHFILVTPQKLKDIWINKATVNEGSFSAGNVQFGNANNSGEEFLVRCLATKSSSFGNKNKITEEDFPEDAKLSGFVTVIRK